MKLCHGIRASSKLSAVMIVTTPFLCACTTFLILVPVSQDIAGIQALEYHMALSLDDKRERQRAHRLSRTLYGRAWNLGGKVFAVYCVIRILSVRTFFLSRCLLLTPRAVNY